jgi:signal transduction histidine kinase
MTAPNQSPGELDAERIAQSPVNVLLVDDDSNNLLALETVLESGNYTLIRAQTSDEALLALMHQEFAAIVLDVQMPGLSGFDLARLIKQRKRTQHIPIIFLTAHYREDEHAVLGYDAGAVDYLTKPIHSAVLKSKVGVFVDLFRKTRALAEMNRTMEAADEALRKANAELEARNAALEREAEERQRRIQAESAQAEAEEANAAKDRFLAMLSHELRTPLSPIIHGIALLEEAEFPPAVRDTLTTIRRNVRLEARLIDDLLDLARIRNGKLRLDLQTVDAHEVLRHAIEICRPDLDDHQLQLGVHLEAGHPHVQGDPARLQQVFWNLLANAIKFTPAGGLITVRTWLPRETGRLCIEVSDTGTGIIPEKIARIFDAFEQGSRNSSAGLGLGLAICRAVVESHGGWIEAESAGPGCGSKFTVHLPVVIPAAARGVPSEPPAPRQQGLKVLVVEDHRDTLDTLERLLVRYGYLVRTAASVAQALEVAASYEFDLLVSDIGLPDGRGTELLATLRTMRGGPLPAIAMSGFGMDEDLAQSREAGFSEHLTKPVEFDSLQRAIARLAAEFSSQSPA